MATRLARRTRAAAFAALAGAALAAPAAAPAASSNKAVRAYPGLRIPNVFVQLNDPGVAPGYVFLTPRAKPGQRTGPTMLDAQGRVVWHHRLPASRTAIGLQPQVYRGKPVLTWGQRPPLREEGDLYSGDKRTVYHLIAGENYRSIKRVRISGRGIGTDLHEFVITRANTALLLGYRTVLANLAPYGGPRRGYVLDSIVQEVDIETGKPIFTWSALRHIPLRDSVVRVPRDEPSWDAYHINSIAEDSDGHLLLTARHASAVYRVHRRTGRTIWQLGGKNSDFKGSGADFHYPHDAVRRPDGTLTIFDNRSSGFDKSKGASRAMHIRLDMRRRTARNLVSFRHPRSGTQATSQGNARTVDGGNVFVGWGSSPWFSEHAPGGRLLFAAHMHSAWNQSYRAFKGNWVGRPVNPPAHAAGVKNGRLTVYAAWNGATELATWRVVGGPDKDSLAPIGEGPRVDFETKLTFDAAPKLVKVQALDANGAVLGESALKAPAS